MPRKLTDTQLLTLTSAGLRDDRCLAPPPKLTGDAMRAFSAKVIAAGLAREIRAKETSPIWRTDVATGRTYTLKLTTKGEGAVAKSEPVFGSSAKITAKRPDAAATAKAGKQLRASSPAAAGADENSDARSEPRANFESSPSSLASSRATGARRSRN